MVWLLPLKVENGEYYITQHGWHRQKYYYTHDSDTNILIQGWNMVFFLLTVGVVKIFVIPEDLKRGVEIV